MTCDACGTELQIGDFPFCPHGRSTLATRPDDVPGGFWIENGFATPQKFYSRSAYQQALAKRGLEQRVKWAGPDDQHITRWDTVDLDAAAQLVQRGAQAIRARQSLYDNPWPRATEPITITEGGVLRRRDLT